MNLENLVKKYSKTQPKVDTTVVTALLRAKLLKATSKRRTYEHIERRLQKLISNREGKLLRLIVFDYGEDSSIHLSYTKALTHVSTPDEEQIGFIYEESSRFIGASKTVWDLWKSEGSKISKEEVVFKGVAYSLSKEGNILIGAKKHKRILVNMVKGLK